MNLLHRSSEHKCWLFALTICSFTSVVGFPQTQEHDPVKDIYRVSCETKSGLAIWIVDGKKVREEIFSEFLYGGNNQRYPFVPEGEIWIDHAIAAEEFNYTVEHEVYEWSLMAKEGLSYDASHDRALMLEHRLRRRDHQMAHDHESHLPRVSPTDSYGEKELGQLQDSILLHDIYRVFVGKRKGIDVWIVDGAAVRRDIYPDFGLSGNDLAYRFIPSREIWIDGDVSCEETDFSIEVELLEREAMLKGIKYDDAYEQAMQWTHLDRIKNRQKAGRHPPVRVSRPLTREQGIKERQ